MGTLDGLLLVRSAWVGTIIEYGMCELNVMPHIICLSIRVTGSAVRIFVPLAMSRFLSLSVHPPPILPSSLPPLLVVLSLPTPVVCAPPSNP